MNQKNEMNQIIHEIQHVVDSEADKELDRAYQAIIIRYALYTQLKQYIFKASEPGEAPIYDVKKWQDTIGG